MQTDVLRIILGAMNFGEQVDESAADHMLAMFLDLGYKEIDTAHRYNDGASEEILGRILTPERRSKVYLATKAHPLNGGGLGPENIVKQVNTSLRRLKTDYVDLLYLHVLACPRTCYVYRLDAIMSDPFSNHACSFRVPRQKLYCSLSKPLNESRPSHNTPFCLCPECHGVFLQS